MGKEWDKFKKINSGRSRKENEITAISRGPENYTAGTPFQQWTTKWAKEALRIATPGATMLVFGGTRTFHRLACGLEDAGWVIKDTLMWLYGSGFPKATDIKKQLNKKVIRECGGDKELEEFNLDKNEDWNGYKSHGLKPAFEPIIMCQKKNEGSYANNALKWGVSGLNIDGSRIGTNDNLNGGAYSGGKRSDGDWKENSGFKNNKLKEYKQPQGRFPANVILDEAGKLLDEQSGVSKSSASNGHIRSGNVVGDNRTPKAAGQFGNGAWIEGSKHNDKGGASRFFKNIPLDSRIIYTPKASKSERQMGIGDNYEIDNTDKYSGKFPSSKADKLKNNHPTVKPLKLMEYLVKLTSMPSKDQIYLDPFLGSGTTAMACKKLDKNWIGIEKEEEYIAIAQARIKAIQRPML